MQKAKLIFLEGADGTGKSTGIKILTKFFKNNGKTIIDLVNQENRKKFLENQIIVNENTVIKLKEPLNLSSEEINEYRLPEILKNTTKQISEQSVENQTKYFAALRDFSYKNIILPCLKKNATIITDRSIISNIVYQKSEINKVLNEEKNQLAIQTQPTHIIIFKSNPEIAIKRIKERNKEIDSFEKEENIKKNLKEYENLRNFETIENTKIITINNNHQKKQDLEKEIEKILEKIEVTIQI